MRITGASEARDMDEYTINKIGISSLVLMENAALGIIKYIEKIHNSIIIICGTGNNGGDGFALARHLNNQGRNIKVYLVGNMEKMMSEAYTNYHILSNLGFAIYNILNSEDIFLLKEDIKNSDAVVDAIFGTGLKRNIEGIYKETISVINENSKFTYSIDIPSGISADTGEVLGTAVRADKTITLNLYKTGFLDYRAFPYTGEVSVCDIGIPEEAKIKFHKNRYITDKSYIDTFWEKRNLLSHKGDFGRALIFAGSRGFTGAARIASRAAVKSGAGLVTLITKDDGFKSLENSSFENMTLPFSDKSRIDSLVESASAIGFGPGLSKDEETYSMFKKVCENSKCPVVIDADGLNVLSDHMELLESGEFILTPHPKEMERLCKINTEDINKNRIEIAENFARERHVTLLLKGYNTVITNGIETYINPTGSSAMATGGMGDTLTGIITSLIAQGYNPLQAAVLGAYIHGLAGDMLSEKMFSVNAADLISEIPYVLKHI